MFKSTMLCAIAILIATPALAQGWPGGTTVGRCMEDPQCANQHRNDYGSNYGNNNSGYDYSRSHIPGDSYQPYPSVSPQIAPLYGDSPVDSFNRSHGRGF